MPNKSKMPLSLVFLATVFILFGFRVTWVGYLDYNYAKKPVDGSLYIENCKNLGDTYRESNKLEAACLGRYQSNLNSLSSAISSKSAAKEDAKGRILIGLLISLFGGIGLWRIYEKNS